MPDVKLLLVQYTKDETHINPAHIEFIVSDHGGVVIHFVSGDTLSLGAKAFVDLLAQIEGTERNL